MCVRPKCRPLRLELLEQKQLLAVDGATLVRDVAQVEQNANGVLLNVLSNDQFDDDYIGQRRITGVSFGSRGGRIAVDESGSHLIYDPPADFHGRETFRYVVDATHSADVEIEIIAPLRDDEFALVPDRPSYTLDVLANDPFWNDYPGERRITLVSGSSTGADVEIADGGKTLNYHRLEHQYGSDTLTYVVDNKYPSSVVVAFTEPVKPDEFQVVQHAPSATFDVLANDPFFDNYEGERLITHLLDAPDAAISKIDSNGKAISFSPQGIPPGFYRLRYVVDGVYESLAVFRVERPVSGDQAFVDANSNAFKIPVLDNDFFYSLDGSRRRIVAVERVTHVGPSREGGDVVVSDDGSYVTYTPPRDFVGVDSFTYLADGLHKATVTVTVRNPLPTSTLRTDIFDVIHGTQRNVLNVLQNDFLGDGYNGPRKITNVDSIEGAAIEIRGGKELLFTPVDNSISRFTFSYQIDDLITASVVVKVRPVSSPLSYTFDTAAIEFLDVVDELKIPVNYLGEGVITAVTPPTNGGTAQIARGGRGIILTPGVGNGSFEYTIDEQYTGTIDTAFHQRLTPDYYAVHQNSGTTKLLVLENDFDESTDRRWGDYRGIRRITHVEAEHGRGTISISEDEKSIVFQPHSDFVGSETIHYVVDGFLKSSAQVDVARLLRHDRVRVAPSSENNVLHVLGNDLTGSKYAGPRNITGLSHSRHGGDATISADGKNVIYSPPAGFEGTDSFEYTVDNQLNATVTVEVRASTANLYPKVDSLKSFQQLVLSSVESLTGFDLTRDEIEDDLSSDGSSSAPRDYSETNVQVEGVDEADLIETDSSYLYTLTHGQLVISQAWPADELKVVSRTDLHGMPIGQYLHGDRLAVISQKADPRSQFFDDVIRPFPGTDSKTLITVFDVSDRSQPKLVQRSEIDGAHVQTRRIDDFVYLVVRDEQSLRPTPRTVCDDVGQFRCSTESVEELKERIQNKFADVVQDLLPNYQSYGPAGELVREGLLIEPEDIYQPISDNAHSLISVVAVNVANNEPGLASATGVLTTGASQLYVTTENLYVFENHFDWQLNSSPDNPTTKILKFSLDRENGWSDFVSSGQVPGNLLNQFSADEFKGDLRVAVGVSNFRTGNFSGVAENALFVLRDDVGVLEHVGEIHNLALGESIRSVRYFGDRALVTTFQTVDPLFSLDLSDASRPQIEGFLTLPGFNGYMQFIDSGHVLTIGRSTGVGGGGVVSISLFDVNDITQPLLIDQFNWGGFSRSVAETDHHAFGWFDTHGTLAIPALRRFWQRSDQDNDGYREHRDLISEYTLNTFHIDTSHTTQNDNGIQVTGSIEMDSPLLRSAYIADKLYAVSEDTIKSTAVSDPGRILDELNIRPLVPATPPVEEGNASERILDLRNAATLALAVSEGVDELDILAVASEADDVSERVALRVGESRFVYEHKNGIVSPVSNVAVNREPSAFDWHNISEPLDATGDGQITARDVLVIINLVNAGYDDALPAAGVKNDLSPISDRFKVDVNDDGFVSPRDALIVINHINSLSRAAAALAADAVFAEAFSELDDVDR